MYLFYFWYFLLSLSLPEKREKKKSNISIEKDVVVVVLVSLGFFLMSFGFVDFFRKYYLNYSLYLYFKIELKNKKLFLIYFIF